MDYAKSGFVATETVVLPAGPLDDFSFSLEPQLRALGLPTQLEKGVIVLREDYVVCQAGNRLSPEQAQILKLIGKPMAEFKITLLCNWTKDGSFEKIAMQKESKKFTASKSNKKINTSIKQLDRSNKKPQETPTSDKETAAVSTIETVQEQEEIMENELSRQTPKESRTHKPTPQKTTKSNNLAKEGAVNKLKPELEDGSEELSNGPMHMQVETLQKQEAVNPRRSLRTPKPIKRTPEQKRLSVKKITESSNKSTPKQVKATPKRLSLRKSKPQMGSEDLEMDI